MIFNELTYPKIGPVFLVDAPGYGYAHAPAVELNNWAKLMHTYLQKSPSYGQRRLKRTLALVDANVGVKQADETLFAYLCEVKVPYIVVLTKTDKLRDEALKKMQREIGVMVSSQWAASPLIFSTSSKTLYGLMELRAYLAYMLQEHTAK